MQIILKAQQLQKGFNKIKPAKIIIKISLFRRTNNHNYNQAAVKWLHKKRSDEVLESICPSHERMWCKHWENIQLPRNAESLQWGEAMNYSTQWPQYSVRVTPTHPQGEQKHYLTETIA